MSNTVTVTKRGKRFVSSFSALPGSEFGPWGFDEMIRDLRVSALLSAPEARDLVLVAFADGSATSPVNS